MDYPRCLGTRSLPNDLVDYVIEVPNEGPKQQPKKARCTESPQRAMRSTETPQRATRSTHTPQQATETSSGDEGGNEELAQLEKDTFRSQSPEVANMRLQLKAMQKQLQRYLGSLSPTRGSKVESIRHKLN